MSSMQAEAGGALITATASVSSSWARRHRLKIHFIKNPA
jgi:hypothetical protein